MNRWVGVGRLTKDPETRYTKDQMAVSRYTLAVDRHTKESKADFIQCVSFGRSAEFAEKYFKKGMRVAVEGRIQTGSYKDRDGRTVYTTEVCVDNHEFAQNKNETTEQPKKQQEEEFLSIPDGVDDAGLPWNE